MSEAWKSGYRRVLKGDDDPINVGARRYAATTGSQMIVEITKETRQAVQAIIDQALREGWGAAKTGRVLRTLVGLTEAQAAAATNSLTLMIEAGLLEEAALRRIATAASKMLAQRCLTIARTEVNNALRTGITELMGEQGVKKVMWVADPECCEICASYNGNEYTIEEYEEIMNPHPNCECTVVIA